MAQITDPTEVLLTAILSMDVYERDPTATGQQPVVAKLTGALGDATFATSRFIAGTEFGATAWNWDGQTIIAYEGTVTANALTILKSAWNGWGVGLGSPYGSQAAAAIKFYNDNVGAGANVVLTGHSLGGGLAGFVAAVYGQQGVQIGTPARLVA